MVSWMILLILDTIPIYHGNILRYDSENSAVGTGLEKVSFHSNPKERQCQRMFKLLHNYTHLTHQQSNAQNSPSKASTLCEPRTSRCSSWIQNGRGTRDQIAHIIEMFFGSQKCFFGSQKKQESSRKTSTLCFVTPKPLTVWITTNCGKFFKRWEYQSS